jgi:hypothetical protein
VPIPRTRGGWQRGEKRCTRLQECILRGAEQLGTLPRPSGMSRALRRTNGTLIPIDGCVLPLDGMRCTTSAKGWAQQCDARPSRGLIRDGDANQQGECGNCQKASSYGKSQRFELRPDLGKTPRGGLNSNQGSLNTGPFRSRGYIDGPSLSSPPGTVPATLNRLLRPFREKSAIRSSWPVTTYHSSTPGSSKVGRHSPATSASAVPGLHRCCSDSSRIHD